MNPKVLKFAQLLAKRPKDSTIALIRIVIGLALIGVGFFAGDRYSIDFPGINPENERYFEYAIGILGIPALLTGIARMCVFKHSVVKKLQIGIGIALIFIGFPIMDPVELTISTPTQETVELWADATRKLHITLDGQSLSLGSSHWSSVSREREPTVTASNTRRKLPRYASNMLFARISCIVLVCITIFPSLLMFAGQINENLGMRLSDVVWLAYITIGIRHIAMFFIHIGLIKIAYTHGGIFFKFASWCLLVLPFISFLLWLSGIRFSYHNIIEALMLAIISMSLIFVVGRETAYGWIAWVFTLAYVVIVKKFILLSYIVVGRLTGSTPYGYWVVQDMTIAIEWMLRAPGALGIGSILAILMYTFYFMIFLRLDDNRAEVSYSTKKLAPRKLSWTKWVPFLSREVIPTRAYYIVACFGAVLLIICFIALWMQAFRLGISHQLVHTVHMIADTNFQKSLWDPFITNDLQYYLLLIPKFALLLVLLGLVKLWKVREMRSLHIVAVITALFLLLLIVGNFFLITVSLSSIIIFPFIPANSPSFLTALLPILWLMLLISPREKIWILPKVIGSLFILSTLFYLPLASEFMYFIFRFTWSYFYAIWLLCIGSLYISLLVFFLKEARKE